MVVNTRRNTYDKEVTAIPLTTVSNITATPNTNAVSANLNEETKEQTSDRHASTDVTATPNTSDVSANLNEETSDIFMDSDSSSSSSETFVCYNCGLVFSSDNALREHRQANYPICNQEFTHFPSQRVPVIDKLRSRHQKQQLLVCQLHVLKSLENYKDINANELTFRTHSKLLHLIPRMVLRVMNNNKSGHGSRNQLFARFLHGDYMALLQEAELPIALSILLVFSK